MSKNTIGSIGTEEFAGMICGVVASVAEPLHARISALERRCRELETRPAIAFKGPYQHNTSYRRGECVQYRGSMWIAVTDTDAQPGLSSEDSRAWVLAVKAGRDGKDAR
jgi:hypothetical protein